MRLAAFLLLLVVGCHYGYDVLALSYADQTAAAKAWFYILRGVEGAALFALVAALTRHPIVFAVCVFGAVEESQTAICRAARPIAERPALEAFQGLCGAPWMWAGLFVALGLAAWVADKLREGRP